MSEQVQVVGRCSEAELVAVLLALATRQAGSRPEGLARWRQNRRRALGLRVR